MSLALFPLVDDHPGTDSRRKFREVLKATPKLIAVFAREAGLTDDKDASARLHAFCSYGGLGLLRFRKQHETGEDETLLAQIIHPRLTNYLHFQKLAHPEERLALSRLMPPTIAYAQTLGFPFLSPQVVNALANRLPKGKHWNVGKGATTAPVRQRSSLSIRKAPRVHEAWVILPLTLTVPIVDEGGNPISNTVHLLLVLDHDSALPMGCWASPRSPGAAEIGLALYQAIWHVGYVDWPLRGVPRAVHIPTALKLTDDSLTDLNRAAFFLGTAMERGKLKETWRKQQLVSVLTYSGQEIITQAVGQPRATCQQVQDAVLHWLFQKRYTTLRTPDVPKHWRDRGYAMLAYDSPAAGWLLPVAQEQARTERDGVVVGGAIYTDPLFRCEPGQRVSYRMFPSAYTGLERGIFIPWNGDLLYLERSQRLPLH
jgi:hypothetical protein